MHTRVALVYRQPRLGQVKTRLAAELGAPATLALYKGFLDDLDACLQAWGGPWDPWVADLEPGEDPRWPDSRLQPEGDLGARMAAAVEGAWAAGAERVLLIGSDAPWLNPAIWGEAEARLAAADVVYGPSPDGGWWLFGCRRQAWHPELFALKAWSHELVLADGLVQARRRGLIALTLEEEADFDTAADLRRFFARPGAARRCPQTARVWAQIGP